MQFHWRSNAATGSGEEEFALRVYFEFGKAAEEYNVIRGLRVSGFGLDQQLFLHLPKMKWECC